MTCGIYKIKNLVNGKLYIGQSVSIEKRWKKHKCFKPTSHLYRAFEKYGINNFTFSIICECPESALDEYEISYIKYYETTDTKKGYNKTFGGGGTRATEETKIKLSESHMGIIPSKQNLLKRSNSMNGKNSGSMNGMFGKPSPMKGKTHTEESKKKMATRCVQCYYNGKIFNSKKEICVEFNITYRQLDIYIKSQSEENRPF